MPNTPNKAFTPKYMGTRNTEVARPYFAASNQ